MKRFASDRVAGLMERLGLEDDIAIESKLVSRTIESAQTRVEGFNFDIRKRVVEFDDVINKQRETIYAERDKVLRNEDLTETVREFLERRGRGAGRAVRRAARRRPSGTSRGWRPRCGRWASRAPRRPRRRWTRPRPRARRWSSTSTTSWTPRLEARGQEHGEEVWSQVERFVLLRTIDSLWVEHLTELDDMRRGIGLRGYAQQDPLNEFRKEAFRLYEELRDLIRRQVATTIFRVSREARARRDRAAAGSGPAGPATSMPTAASTTARRTTRRPATGPPAQARP